MLRIYLYVDASANVVGYVKISTTDVEALHPLSYFVIIDYDDANSHQRGQFSVMRIANVTNPIDQPELN